MTRELRLMIVVLSIACAGATTCTAQARYLEKTPRRRAAELKSGRWIETIAREIPPLKNDLGDQAPMIMWHGVGFEPLAPNEIEVLRARGLCQHLQLAESMIPAAKVLGQAGMPIILMEGRTDSWPYSLTDSSGDPSSDSSGDPSSGSSGDPSSGDASNGDPSGWAHQFDASYQQPWFGKEDAHQWHGACPQRTDGWKVLAKRTRQTLHKFRDAGLRVDAVLVDYEGDPYPWSHLFEQLRHCKRCRRELPREIIHNKAVWRDYAWKQYVSLYDEHFAKPVREVFPDCLVTNWHVVYSSEANPVRYFVRDVKLPVLKPDHFSATNPIAYASDTVWHELWNRSEELTQDSVDAFYAQQMVQQVESDKRNREAAGAADVRSIPWVARVCRIADSGKPAAPMMSRASYRKSLHTLWDLGVHTVQVFNPMHEGYEELALTELQDAVAVYDEMLQRKR